MKRLFYLLMIPAVVLASCGGKDTKTTDTKKADSAKAGRVTPVAVTEVQPVVFNANVEIQAAITGDEVVTAAARTPQGTVQQILVQVGQSVHKGQVLATLDANVVEEQIRAMQPQIDLLKSLYEKQKGLWAQNIGTEVQLMQAKTAYESSLSQKTALQAQRALYNIVSPIDGVVDQVNLKIGDPAAGPNTNFQIVNMNKMKAVASLGENYLGKVKEGNPVTLVFSGTGDSIKTKLTYVSQSVNPMSRAFDVQVKLGSDKKLHPNMSCIMKIANYNNPAALTVPVSVIQNTPNGSVVYIADNGKAKAATVKTGQTADGMVEILSGLNAGDQVVTTGFEDLSDGDAISVQK